MNPNLPSRRLHRLAALFLAVAAPAGCGYHVAGHNNALPPEIHVIAIPAMENATTSYRIEQRFTSATVHEFLAKTQLRVVSNPANGDAVDPRFVMVMDVAVWQSLCAQALGLGQ